MEVVVALPALQLAAEVDLDGVPTCPMCLFDLAWEIHEGRTPSRGLVSRTADWVWMESELAFAKRSCGLGRRNTPSPRRRSATSR
jgi:hypothetical protein